jgi:hypothetical protein
MLLSFSTCRQQHLYYCVTATASVYPPFSNTAPSSLPPRCLFSLRTRANALEEERNKLESDISLLRSDFKKASLDFDSKIEGQVPTQGSVSAVDAGIGANGVSAREKEEEVKNLLVSVTCQSIMNDKLFIFIAYRCIPKY